MLLFFHAAHSSTFAVRLEAIRIQLDSIGKRLDTIREELEKIRVKLNEIQKKLEELTSALSMSQKSTDKTLLTSGGLDVVAIKQQLEDIDKNAEVDFNALKGKTSVTRKDIIAIVDRYLPNIASLFGCSIHLDPIPEGPEAIPQPIINAFLLDDPFYDYLEVNLPSIIASLERINKIYALSTSSDIPEKLKKEFDFIGLLINLFAKTRNETIRIQYTMPNLNPHLADRIRKFRFAQLRPLSHDKLMIACGNRTGVHAHKGYDTIDQNMRYNPSVIFKFPYPNTDVDEALKISGSKDDEALLAQLKSLFPKDQYNEIAIENLAFFTNERRNDNDRNRAVHIFEELLKHMAKSGCVLKDVTDSSTHESIITKSEG